MVSEEWGCTMERKARLYSHLALILLLVALFFIAATNAMAANGAGLQAIDISSVEGNHIRLHLQMSEPVSNPVTFAIDNPARVVLDFSGVKVLLPKDKAHPQFDVGVVRRVSAVEAQNKLRVVIDLNQMVPYETKVEGKDVYVTLATVTQSAVEHGFVGATPFAQNDELFKENLIPTKTSKTGAGHTQQQKAAPTSFYRINNIDFRRGSKNEGRIIVDLSNEKLPIDLKQEGQTIKIRFMGTGIKESLQRKLDVTDFGTPVTSISTRAVGRDVEMQIDYSGDAENIAYQADKRFTVEIRPLSKQEKEDLKNKKFEYTGERLSLNFQDIEVRAVLQLIADFTGLNIVTSDTVKGNVTLRLKNVPWDQALDIILKTKGLDKRQDGNVLMIGPSEEISAREKLELQSHHQVSELAPLRTEYIQLNYAKASDVAKLLKDQNTSMLSSRGTVSVDDRTNILLVQDTSAKLDEIRKLLHRLDIPVRQVLIESRVVFANDDFEAALGVKLGSAIKFRPGAEPRLGFTGNRVGSDQIANLQQPTGSVSIGDRLNVDLGPNQVNGNDVTSGFGLTIAALPGGTILDLELRALESEGLGTVLASPRLITSNQQTAHIESGEEIPYLEATSSGAASVSFKKAVLKLEVTPQITPDDNIILDLQVNQDARSNNVGAQGIPAIATREIHTKVLVPNGDTVVLGGIYQQQKSNSVSRIPVLGKLPGIGWLFRNKYQLDKRNELMIFVTPKIIQDNLS